MFGSDVSAGSQISFAFHRTKRVTHKDHTRLSTLRLVEMFGEQVAITMRIIEV